MYLSYLFSGLLLGILSSFHCVGMCGAIAASLPIGEQAAKSKLRLFILYHLGRVGMYTLLGLFFGVVGRQFFIGGIQQWLSIVLGCSIVVFVLVFHQKKFMASQFPVIGSLYKWVQNSLVKALQLRGGLAMLTIGLLNALLPCGMVYLAIAGALTSTSFWGAGIFMFGFGLGTIPLMLWVSYMGSWVNLSVRNQLKKAMPYAMLLVGVLLIFRGLNLDIPYISPSISPVSSGAVSCH